MSLACMENRQSHYFAILVTNDDVVVGELAVISMARLLEIQIQNVRFLIVAAPDSLEGYFEQLGCQVQNLLDVYLGHSFIFRWMYVSVICECQNASESAC